MQDSDKKQECQCSSGFSACAPEHVVGVQKQEFWPTENVYTRMNEMIDFIKPEAALELVDAGLSIGAKTADVSEETDYSISQDPEMSRVQESLSDSDTIDSYIIDYLNTHDEPSFEEFCTESNLEGNFRLRQKFEKILEENKPVIESDYSSAALSLLNASENYHETTRGPAESAQEKFDTIYDCVCGVLMGNSLKKHFFLAGDAGCGKSFTVKNCFNQNWGASPLRKEGWIYTFDKGSVGKSLSALTAYLYSHRDREVIVLDDCDGFLKSGNDDIMNLLKGVLDTENTLENLQPISTDPNIRSLGGKYITPRSKKDTLTYKPVRECRIDSHFDGAEFVVNVNGHTFREAADKGPQLPESFTFSSRLIMISNLSPKDIDDAFRSRCTVYALTLTHKEFAAHLSKIISGMMEELETRLDKSLVRQIRDTVYEWFVSLIELEGKEIFGRKVVIKCPLQFRLIPDFAQFFYVAMMSYIQKYKNDLRQVPSEKKFEVIAQGIQPRVILQMLDTLSDSVYIAKK